MILQAVNMWPSGVLLGAAANIVPTFSAANADGGNNTYSILRHGGGQTFDSRTNPIYLKRTIFSPQVNKDAVLATANARLGQRISDVIVVHGKICSDPTLTPLWSALKSVPTAEGRFQSLLPHVILVKDDVGDATQQLQSGAWLLELYVPPEFPDSRNTEKKYNIFGEHPLPVIINTTPSNESTEDVRDNFRRTDFQTLKELSKSVAGVSNITDTFRLCIALAILIESDPKVGVSTEVQSFLNQFWKQIPNHSTHCG